MKAQTKRATKSQSRTLPKPIAWFRVVLEEQTALPQAIPDKCPKCGADFTRGLHLEEMSATFFYVDINKSGALGQDDKTGESAYGAELYPMGYRCSRCEYLVVGNDTVE